MRDISYGELERGDNVGGKMPFFKYSSLSFFVFYFLKCCLIAGIFCLWLGKRYVHEPPQKNKEKQQLTIKNLSWAGFTK